MDIDAVIDRLIELKAQGATRVFIEDMTRGGVILDLITIDLYSDGDVIMGSDVIMGGD